MRHNISEVDILFVAGFGPITQDFSKSKNFYQDTLGLPLKTMDGNNDYLLIESGTLTGVKHFALWPLYQAALSCFGTEQWPQDLSIPQSWIEFEVADLDTATNILLTKGWQLLVNNRQEPWGQRVTRLLSPEGMLVGVTVTPWLHD
ncbi:VOC family protein [Xenorhabdus stockiae]|uniref:VOC family protein n=1 Tax=Xenorhabdus stockiae TaxID=351614 RepID=UPI003CF93CE5